MAAVLDRLQQAWDLSDRLFGMLGPDAMAERPIPLRHPFVFYLGHLPAFGNNQVLSGLLGRPGVRPEFDDLFERGIDPLDGDTPVTTGRRWPEVAAIEAYRDRVRGELLEAHQEVLDRGADDPMAHAGRVYHVVLEHELMHHETLLYMLHQLDRRHLRRPDDLPPLQRGSAGHPAATARIQGGEAVLGARFEAQPFGWDNEFPERRVAVPSFDLDILPVTLADYVHFVEDDGYGRADLWALDDWEFVQRSGLEHPLFWTRQDGRWLVRTLFEDVPLDEVDGWPVYVSWAEAQAFARWSGRRLPTEAELHRATFDAPDGSRRAAPWGDAALGPEHGNFGLRHWAPTPVGGHPAGASAFGVQDLLGNGWEWTSTTFGPFPGFEAYMPHYRGYSADFFDHRHFVMLGGSWATAPELLRRSFRNWFQPHYPFVFAGFRLASAA